MICSPLHAEFMTNYRREVLLARTLAARGVAVQRFHYRGSGNSYDDPGATTFGSMLEDTLAATDRLRQKTGLAEIAHLGTRIGALVAAAAGRASADSVLLLWEPTVDPSSYFRDLFRASLIRDLTDDSSGRRPAGAQLETLRANGSVDVLGYLVHRDLYESVVGRSLVSEIGDGGRHILIVQLGRDQHLRRENRDLVATLEASGASVTGRVVAANESWWFVNEPKRSKAVGAAVVDLTTGWLLAALGTGALR